MSGWIKNNYLVFNPWNPDPGVQGQGAADQEKGRPQERKKQPPPLPFPYPSQHYKRKKILLKKKKFIKQ